MDGLIFAYHVPYSSEQRKFTERRTAEFRRQRQLAAAAKDKDHPAAYHIERTVSGTSAHSRSSNDGHEVRMEGRKNGISSVSTSSTGSADSSNAELLNSPFDLRHGRRYLRDLPYPLPVDLAELQRQNLRTLIGCSVFGQPLCSPRVRKHVPQRVLEIGCGSGYWSATCHQYFSSLGHNNVHFVGLDVAPLAPDFQKQGMKWTFVQHDIRRLPLPFDDEDFDLIMLKDLSLTLPFIGTRSPFERILDECIRLLREDGILEVWDGEHLTRSILPHPPPLAGRQRKAQEIATRTATFLTAPGTPFAPPQNKYLNQANGWIEDALDRKRLPATPCSPIAQYLYQEPDRLGEIDYRRIAIPLGEQRWERETYSTKHSRSSRVDSHHPDLVKPTKTASSQKAMVADGRALTADQRALRQTALLSVVQFIESLEPLLTEASGKNTEEWSHWWSSMMSNLMDPNRGAVNGECLEIGAWWCVKIGDS